MKDALFYHIPRTGGFMLATKVWDQIGRDNAFTDKGQRHDGHQSDDTGNPDWVKYDGPFVSSHEPVSLLTRHEEGRVRFTVLRDPFERVLSLLNFRQNQIRAMGLSNVDYMMQTGSAAPPSVQTGFRDRMVRQLGGNFYRDDMPIKEQFDKACEVLAGLDYVFYTSELDDVLPEFFTDVLEIPWDGPRRINVAKSYIEDLSPHEQETIQKLTNWDRQLYSYAQELTASR